MAWDMHLSSPTGASAVLKIRSGKSGLSSFGMYRAEADVGHLVTRHGVSALLFDCISLARTDEKMVFIYPKGLPRGDDKSFDLIGERKGYLMFLASHGLTPGSLGFVERMAYGSASFIGLRDDVCIPDQSQLEPDLHGCISSLGDRMIWGVEYDESGVVTLISRNFDIIKNQASNIIGGTLGGIFHAG